jgi:hypothetical protein
LGADRIFCSPWTPVGGQWAGGSVSPLARAFASYYSRTTDFARLVFSLFDEECVTQPIVERPLQEIDCDDDPRLQPAAELHLVGCDPVVEFYTPFGSVLLKYSSRVAAFQALFRIG